MGLLYPFPSTVEEVEFLSLSKDNSGNVISLELKSYGLPMLFWGYGLASILAVFMLFLAGKESIYKLMSLGDETDYWLGIILLGFIILIPLVILGFLLFQKKIFLDKNHLKLTYVSFFIPFFTESFNLTEIESLSVDHFMDSPNMARMQNKEENLPFQNRGYYLLNVRFINHRIIAIDRHSQKRELEKIKSLLEMILKS